MPDDVNPASRAFQERILNDLLPTYCNDPSRAWGAAGFKDDCGKITEVDAADFLRGMDGELAKHEGRGLYRAPRSRAREQFFWPGAKKTVPRTRTLWAEPIITVAVVARLHFDLGWPKELIGTQSLDWAFDVTAYLSIDSKIEFIACEVKKSVREMNQLVEHMIRFGTASSVDQLVAPKDKELNAFRKLRALRRRKPPLFLAVAPGGIGRAFSVQYPGDDIVRFQEIAVQQLAYDRTQLATGSSARCAGSSE